MEKYSFTEAPHRILCQQISNEYHYMAEFRQCPNVRLCHMTLPALPGTP